MQHYLILHYGEIALKGDNRQYFEKILIANIKSALQEFGEIKLRSIYGRLIIPVEATWDLTQVQKKLQKVFGLEYFVWAWSCEQKLEDIGKALVMLLKDKKFKTFRLTVRRVNKNFSLNSMELSRHLGALVVKKKKKKVDLKKFDLNCYVDVVDDYAFIYFEKNTCLGGLPVGSSGRLLSLISGGIDSPVASYLMQKRGSRITYVNFDSYPSTPKESQGKIIDLVTVLNEYQFGSKIYFVPFLEIQKEILVKVPEDYRVIFYRRMMLRICNYIACKENILGLLTGDSLGQVASQTIENIRAISQATDLPILRPLIGSNKSETIKLAEKIGTYDISNQPYSDCCSLFVPKHPVTKANLNIIAKVEQGWDWETFIKTAVAQAKIITI